jgi:hypothetical protein
MLINAVSRGALAVPALHCMTKMVAGIQRLNLDYGVASDLDVFE